MEEYNLNKNNNYIVITGDVIASKKHKAFKELFANSGVPKNAIFMLNNLYFRCDIRV